MENDKQKELLKNYKKELALRWPENIMMEKETFNIIFSLIDDLLEAQKTKDAEIVLRDLGTCECCRIRIQENIINQ